MTDTMQHVQQSQTRMSWQHSSIQQREIIKLVPVIEQKIVQIQTICPQIVEVQKIVQRIVPFETIIDRIVEVPRIVEKIITVQQQILKIVEVPSCCCHKNYKDFDDITRLKSLLVQTQQNWRQQVVFIKENMGLLAQQNEQLRQHIEQLQNALQQLKSENLHSTNELNIGIIKEESMEMSQSQRTILKSSGISLQSYDFLDKQPEVQQGSSTFRDLRSDLRDLDAKSDSLRSSYMGSIRNGWNQTKNDNNGYCIQQFVKSIDRNEAIILLLTVKMTQKIKVAIEAGSINLHKPQSIGIGFGDDKNVDIVLNEMALSQTDCAFLPPQSLIYNIVNQKSCVYNIASICDQLMHGSPYFDSKRSVMNLAFQYQCRNKEASPVLIKTLQAMLCKNVNRRPTIAQAYNLLKKSLHDSRNRHRFR